MATHAAAIVIKSTKRIVKNMSKIFHANNELTGYGTQFCLHLKRFVDSRFNYSMCDNGTTALLNCNIFVANFSFFWPIGIGEDPLFKNEFIAMNFN